MGQKSWYERVIQSLTLNNFKPLQRFIPSHPIIKPIQLGLTIIDEQLLTFCDVLRGIHANQVGCQKFDTNIDLFAMIKHGFKTVEYVFEGNFVIVNHELNFEYLFLLLLLLISGQFYILVLNLGKCASIVLYDANQSV